MAVMENEYVVYIHMTRYHFDSIPFYSPCFLGSFCGKFIEVPLWNAEIYTSYRKALQARKKYLKKVPYDSCFVVDKKVALSLIENVIEMPYTSVYHNVKINSKYFCAVASGTKTFEVRLNDRNYNVGDTLVLREYENDDYTGKMIEKRIVYILDDSKYCKEGFVVLGLK